jgi:tetratricopeptide (TPR) repeat protein
MVESRSRRPERVLWPEIPDDVKASDLDRDVRAELTSLPALKAERIARHLVMAGLLLDDDPDAAYAHAKAARDGAGRVGACREALGVAAYRTGNYAEALAELRAARRITGDASHLPLIADCERGLGRPERALATAKDPDATRLDRAGQIEMRIVLAGARRDLGQPDAAVLLLRGPDLDPPQLEEWTPRLWYAYADACAAAGRTDEAREYFEAVAALDADGDTDAADRLAAL